MMAFFAFGLPTLLYSIAAATNTPAMLHADSLSGKCGNGECSKEQVLLQHFSMSARTTVASQADINIASYNLFWWNAFKQNAWKSNHVIDNIKSFQADTLGLQECDEPRQIEGRAGYIAASPFKGAQGVVVKPGVFKVEQAGSSDIRATGKWGPRYVTWAELTHLDSGRRFWHFNTHWCVHSGNGHTCTSDTRHVGAKNMLAVIREKAGTESPVVVTGDFNAELGEAGPQYFLQNGFSLAINNWVDSIFVSTEHWEVRSTSVGDFSYSDHRPVIARLRLK